MHLATRKYWEPGSNSERLEHNRFRNPNRSMPACSSLADTCRRDTPTAGR